MVTNVRYKPSGMSMLDYIMAADAAAKNKITLEEFTYIRNHGTPEEIKEAVERMEAMGGYDCLE